MQKEMYTFDDGGGRSLTLRPEGTAPVCRAYLEHGMHKLPQPVKLWYLELLPRRGAAAGPLPAVLAGRGRGDRLRRARDRRRADRAARRAARAVGVRGTRLRLSSLGTPETRAEYREELERFLRAHEDELRRRGPQPDRPEPDAGVRLERRGYASGDARRAEAPGPARPRRRRALRAGLRRCSTTPGPLRARPDARARAWTTTRARCSSSPATQLGAQSGVGGGGRYDGLIEQLDGPPTPACGWAAGVERMLLAARRAPARRPSSSTCSSRSPSADGARTAFELAREARRAGLQRATRARRPLAEGPAQARRPDRRPLRRDHRRRRRRDAQGHGVRRAARHRRRRRDPGRSSAGAGCREARAAAERVPRRLVRPADRRSRRHRGARGRLGAPPPRPRRPDLHRRARPLGHRAARVPSRDRARRRTRRRTSSAPRT